MMINSARPNIKLDKALQDIVYKLVPGLFQREMARRREFYASRPELAADVTPEQRGEDTERIVFSPEDVISFSLEYADIVDDTVSSGSSESGNEAPPSDGPGGPTRRYLRCPAVVNISHLKKFLSLKFDIDVAHFFVDILYKRVPLPDYYTLMDIAYIYNWKRIEPMRFFYQITDFTAIRDRFGFMELGNTAGGGRGRGPEPLNEPPPSDASSGSSSPAPDDALSCSKSRDGFTESDDKNKPKDDDSISVDLLNSKSPGRHEKQFKTPPSADVEKSQFLNSFELTAKTTPEKSSSPQKEESKTTNEKIIKSEEIKPKISNASPETNSTSKRKSLAVPESSIDSKKLKSEESTSKIKQDSSKSSIPSDSPVLETLLMRSNSQSTTATKHEQKPVPDSLPIHKSISNELNAMNSPQGSKMNVVTVLAGKSKSRKVFPIQMNTQTKLDINAIAKKCKNSILRNLSMKRKLDSSEESSAQMQSEKSQVPPKLTSEAAKDRQMINTKSEPKHLPNQNAAEKTPVSKSACMSKPNMLPPTINIKSDPVVKITQMKEPPKVMSAQPKKEGDPLRSLFNSCNINIPSSLSITLTDQKLDEKSEMQTDEPKKIETKKVVQTTTSNPVSNNPAMQISTEPIITPPDKNYLEIIKLPDVETPKPLESSASSSKPTNPTGKPSEPGVSPKGPVPNLKPISEANFPKPQTFQQTFLQSLQQHKEKPKFNKTRLVLPKFKSSGGPSEEPSDPSSIPKTNNPVPKPQTTLIPSIQKMKFPISIKPDSALDLSTPHTIQSQLGPQQAKALETMQSIAKLAKKQCSHQRLSTTFSPDAFKAKPSTSSALRIPVTPNNGQLKINSSQSQSSPKHFPEYFQPIKQPSVHSPNDTNSNQSSKPPQMTPPPYSQASERSQTRSPSSSPKLVIACPSPKSQSPEQKQYIPPKSLENNNQTNLISSSHISSTNTSSSDTSGFKDASKILKSTKPPSINRLSTIKGNNSNNSSGKSSGPNSSLTGNDIRNMAPQFLAQQAYLRQQLELQTTYGLLPPGAAKRWLNSPYARAHFESLVKNLSDNNQLPFGNSHNSKEKP